MRKVFLITTLFFACFIGANAQNFLNIKFSKVAVASGDTANIDITVTNFNQLYGAQFSINWDSLKFKYAGISNKISNTALPGDLDVGFPPTTLVKNGQATLLWSNPSAVSLPNDTRLVTLRLKAIGAPCDSTAITMSDKPIKSEYYNENFEIFKPVSVAGQAKINGPGCTGGGGGTTGNELMVTAPSLTAGPNTEVCIPLTVKNFKDIEGVQSKIKWDPAVLKIKQPIPPLKYDALPGNSFNTGAIGAGELTFVWIPGASSGAVTIPDGQRLMEVCFDVIGAAGTMSPIDLIDKDAGFETEYTNTQGASVPFIYTDGKVTVTDQPTKILKLIIADVTAVQNDSIDVSFTVNNYIDVKAAQFGVTFDPNVLQFGRRYMDAVPSGAGGALSSAGTYKFNFVADGSSSVTLADGALLFKLRFKVAPCQNGATASLFSTVNVTDLPNFLIEFIDKNVNKLNYTVDQGSVTAPCGGVVLPTCNIVSSTNVSCNGLANGSITVEVTNASGCQCAWQKNGTAFGNPIPTPNCNLTNIGPGVYTLFITCDGAQRCSSSVTIKEEPAINITGAIDNVSCNTLGSITLDVKGGVGTYTYLWSPNNATTKDLTNLNANSYTVTVTDEAKCTATKSFTVIQLPSGDLTVDPQVVNVKCFGINTGSIKLEPKGGCTPFNFNWQNDPTNKTDTRSNLAPGTYGVTVTDGSTPSKSVALQINVAGPTSEISIAGIVTNSTGSNGAIDISAIGGTAPLSFKWSDGPTTDDRTGLAPNTYNLVVTDANGCTKSTSLTVILVTEEPKPTLGDIKVTSESTNAGYGVSCVNECDGVIGGNASGGTPPYTIVLSGQASKTITQAAAGPFSFTGLCTGSYKVKLTDSKNVASTEATFNVTQPTAIIVSREINCANGVIPTGSIALTVSGGAGGYTYKWSNNKITKDIENLSVGSYAVVVADANGCQSVLTNLRVTDCNNAGENCYEEFTNIITPNGDGINEFFEISCAASVENDLFVYDRWGNLVYSQKNYDNLWNGVSSSGTELPENAYMWVLVVKDNGTTLSTNKGTVTILRAE